MDIVIHPKPTRSHLESRPMNLVGELLFDRASVAGLECTESGWDEWDICVAEQDLRLAMVKALH